MAIIKRTWFILLLAFFHVGCTTVQHISNSKVRYESINAESTPASNEEITGMIAPYKEKLDDQMNEVIGNVRIEMNKKKPESTLGNWVADAMLAGAKKEGYPVDFALSNYGGLRIPYLAAGPLTMGEVYELSPFDNLIVIVDVPGNILDSLLQHIAASEGWPVSTGIQMTIQNKKMVSCLIGGNTLNPASTYKVAMSDYVAGGGDEMSMLIPLSRIQTGKIVRNAIIDYARESTRNGKDISATIEGRIVNQ